MPLNSLMSVMSVVEFLLWAVLAYFFWAKKLQKRFPAMGAYLALRVTSTPLLLAILWWGQHYYDSAYFFGYYAVYIASAVLLFFVITGVGFSLFFLTLLCLFLVVASAAFAILHSHSSTKSQLLHLYASSSQTPTAPRSPLHH